MSDKIYEIDLKAVEQLAEIVEQKKLDEITITDGEKSITIKGKKCPPPPHHHPPHPGEMPPPPPMNNGMPSQWGTGAPNGQPPETTPQPTPSATEPTATGKFIQAPIVGTFYAAPSPDQPPFVQVGDTVKKGDVVLIIESMKLMNEVTSDVDGVVEEILVKNGDAVEYDQPLMRLS